MSSNTLTASNVGYHKNPDPDIELVENKERVVIRRMRKIVEQGAIDATQIDDDATEPPTPEPGEKPWKADRLRVANDMRKAKRFAPVYLEIAQRSVEKHDDRQVLQVAPTQLNIGTINVVQAAVYPAIELEVKE